MPYTLVVIGQGRTVEEALLFSRVNQICNDEYIDTNTISNKVEYVELPTNLYREGRVSASMAIMMVHFAYAYHRFMENRKNGIEGEFTESEYKYYAILAKSMNREEFNRLMNVYVGNEPNVCIAVRENSSHFRFMY